MGGAIDCVIGTPGLGCRFENSGERRCCTLGAEYLVFSGMMIMIGCLVASMMVNGFLVVRQAHLVQGVSFRV